MEDYAYILDYLIQGHPDNRKFKREPISYALGESEFKLLELVPKPNANLQIGDRIYIGKDLDDRVEILHVKRRIGYPDLTSTAQAELPYIIEEIVLANEARYIEFYNNAQPISTRFHMLELLPGLGKKTMFAILEERKKSAFESFKEVEKRVSSIHQPHKLVCKRIELEISDAKQKYHLFAAK